MDKSRGIIDLLVFMKTMLIIDYHGNLSRIR